MKTAIITGGTKGIGYAISTALSKEDYRIILLGRSPKEEVKDILNTLSNSVYVQGNINNAHDRQKCLDVAGKVDLLINNAGVAPKERVDILDLSEEDYTYVMDINLKGAFFLTQQVATKMIKENMRGCIINISSISAYTTSVNRAAYCVSKAGLSMSTKLFAERLAEHGIMVYEIRPGIIETDMTNSVTEKYNHLIMNENLIPIKRWGIPEDVAKVTTALANGLLPYSTGEVINIDGGFHLRRL